MENTALSSQTEQASMSNDSATRLTTDSPEPTVLLQPGHHHVVQLQRSASYGSGSPKSSEASEESSEDDDDASSTDDDDDGSDVEIIEAEEYEEGGWSDEEDEETRKVRELKKKLHGSGTGHNHALLFHPSSFIIGLALCFHHLRAEHFLSV